jgi:hypothetical protein
MCCKVLYSQIKVTAHEGAAAQQQPLPTLRSSFKLAVVRVAAFTFWVLQAVSIVALA